MSKTNQPIVITDGQSTITVRHLTLQQLKRIDHLLEQLGPFGEVRIIVQRGEAKYTEALKRYKVQS